MTGIEEWEVVYLKLEDALMSGKTRLLAKASLGS